MKFLSKEKGLFTAKDISIRTKVSYSSIQRALKVLRRTGDVIWKQNRNPNGHHPNQQYFYRGELD